MKVIDIIKAKLSDPKPADELLEMYILEVGQTIKNYCNRSDIPAELSFVHANMVVDFIKRIDRSVDPEGNTSVSSIKEGDVSVQFGSARIESRERATEKLLFNYSEQLNRFRKMGW